MTWNEKLIINKNRSKYKKNFLKAWLDHNVTDDDATIVDDRS